MFCTVFSYTLFIRQTRLANRSTRDPRSRYQLPFNATESLSPPLVHLQSARLNIQLPAPIPKHSKRTLGNPSAFESLSTSIILSQSKLAVPLGVRRGRSRTTTTAANQNANLIANTFHLLLDLFKESLCSFLLKSLSKPTLTRPLACPPLVLASRCKPLEPADPPTTLTFSTFSQAVRFLCTTECACSQAD
jgi:hypothetical protein